MALLTSLSRRKIFAGVLAPTALGVAAAVAIAWPQPTVPTVADPALAGMASTADCHDMVSIGIGGRNDTPRDQTKMLVDEKGNVLPAAQQGEYKSHWVDPVINAPLKEHEAGNGYAAVYVEYPADLGSYEQAVTTGADNTVKVMQAIQASCPDTQFAIVGFSEGADVARRAALQIGNQEAPAEGDSWAIVDPESVTGVVILSDAGRATDEGFFPGAENGNPDNYDRPYQPGKDPVSGGGVLPGTNGEFGHLNGKVASFCSEGDFACSTPENIALLELLVNVGRQVNGDALEREGLTPATGADLAQVVGGVALMALVDISANENWMRSDETFLDVLIKVSDPAYDPAAPAATPAAADGDDAAAEPIPADRLANLAYLPEKVLKEIVGFVTSNQNTLAVVLSDPYEQTFGYDAEKNDHYGHHFDYWDDNIDGEGTTTVGYAADWLTHLAEQAKQGKAVSSDAEAKAVRMAAVQTPEPSETTEASETTETSETQLGETDAQTTTVGEGIAPTPSDPATAGTAPSGDPALTAPSGTTTPVAPTVPTPTAGTDGVAVPEATNGGTTTDQSATIESTTGEQSGTTSSTGTPTTTTTTPAQPAA
ncbi:cutinase family protein [Rhodococcus chondri]|uniref:Cutinase family protein n=1 Tax=Rhodococcus chondri TaxID=3065941 RepID=A0ABU7JME4_9NOCA|nr:cutinase family protein [Rhodococcus sp. CC-R104]MEE2031205.1 cutinase family protein [Rhodococcus sp. CC-R104]